MCPNDIDRSDPHGLSSLGVVDLDLSITPDVFGLRAFDVAKPLARMLPGPFPNELRLMIPDLGIAPEGFHDILIEDLSATPSWQLHRLLPEEVTSLRRRWPKILFRTRQKRLVQPPGVGVSKRSSGPLLPVPGRYRDRLG